METKRNYKYFTAQGINYLLIAGLIVCIFGIVLLFVEQTRSFGMVVILLGTVIAVFGSGAKSGEADIDNQIYAIVKEMPEQAQIKYEVYEKDFIKIINPILIKGYDFSKPDMLCKKGPDSVFRSDSYNVAQLYFTREKVYIHGRHISLIDSSEEANAEFGGVYRYAELDKAYVEESRVKYKKREIKVFTFVLPLVAGGDAIRFPVEYGADVDKACEDINHVKEKMSERAAERAADKAAKRAALHALDNNN